LEAALRVGSQIFKVLISEWYCAMVESLGKKARLAMCLVEAVAATGMF
jgi:hypothetical protein